MESTRRAWWIGAAGAVLLVISLAAPPAVGHAATPQPAPTPTPTKGFPTAPPWVSTHCATAEITDYAVRPGENGAAGLTISGWIQPCAGAAPGDFALIWYTPTVGVPHLRSYASLTAPTSFEVDTASLSSALTAVCVASAADWRLACLRFDAGAPGEPPIVGPTTTDDPRVLVRTGPPVRITDPTCGTCA